jgi:predicted dehydrogenase
MVFVWCLWKRSQDRKYFLEVGEKWEKCVVASTPSHPVLVRSSDCDASVCLVFRNLQNMIGIAIIGCGLIGRTHALALRDLGQAVTSFFDIDSSRAETLANEFGGEPVCDLDQIFADPRITAVYICTHHDTHVTLAVRAANAGKNIFLEKPMALTEAGCREIMQAVDSAGVKCMTGFKLRFYPLVNMARSLVEVPTLITATIMDTRWPDDSWANDPIMGGGNVLSQGCHGMDLLCYLAKSEPVRVFAEGGNMHHPGLAITDTMCATISFRSGAVATIAVADSGETPLVGKFSFQALDGFSSIQLSDRLKTLTHFDGTETHTYSDSDELGFLEENREFISALTDNRIPQPNHHDGFRASMMILKAIESINTGLPQNFSFE